MKVAFEEERVEYKARIAFLEEQLANERGQFARAELDYDPIDPYEKFRSQIADIKTK